MPNIRTYWRHKPSEQSSLEIADNIIAQNQYKLKTSIQKYKNSLPENMLWRSIKKKLDFILASDIYRNTFITNNIITRLQNNWGLPLDKQYKNVIELYNIVIEYNKTKGEVKKDTSIQMSNILPQSLHVMSIRQARNILEEIDLLRLPSQAKQKIENIKQEINGIQNKVEAASKILDLALEAKRIYDEEIKWGGKEEKKKQSQKEEENKTLKELEKLFNLSIDWEITGEDFSKYLDEYISELEISSTEKQILKQNILEIYKWLEKWKKVQLKFLNDYFNKLWEQLTKYSDKDTNIKIDFWDGQTVIFKDRKQAINYINILKRQAEDEFQSFARITIEWTANFVWNFVKTWWNILKTPFVLSYELLKKGDLDSLLWVWAYIWSFLIAYTLSNSYSSIIKNINARIISSEFPLLKKFAIWEYLQESHPFADNAWDTKESVQLTKRKNILKILKATYKNDKDRMKILNEAEKFINVLDHNLDDSWKDTSDEKKIKKTFRYAEWIFWDKVWQALWMWKFHDKYSPIKNKYIDILLKPLMLNKRSKIISYVENNFTSEINDKVLDPLKKYFNWVSFDYENVRLKFSWENYSDVKWENIKYIEEYIRWRQDLSLEEKKELKQRVNRYFENIFNSWEVFSTYEIEEKIWKIIEWKIIDIKDFKDILKKDNRIKDLFKWVIFEWRYDEKFNDILNWKKRISKLKIFTRKKTIQKLIDLMNSWKLELTEKEFKDLIDNKIFGSKFNNFIESIKDIKFTSFKDFYKSLWKFWNSIWLKPKQKKVNFNFEDILKTWEKVIESKEKAKEILSWELWENLRNIIDLDSINFPNDKERFFEKKVLKILEKKVNNWKYTEEQLRLELIKISKWYLPAFKSIKILKNLLSEEELNKKEIKEIKAQIEKWEILIRYEDKDSLVEKVRNWWIILVNENFDIESELKKLKEKWEELWKKHFKNDGFWIYKNKKLQEGLLKNIKDYAIIINYNSRVNIDSKYNILIWDITQWVDFTYEEFFTRLKTDLNIKWWDINEWITLQDFKLNIKNELSSLFDGLTPEEKIKLKEFIKNNEISLDILPENIKDFMVQKGIQKEQKEKEEFKQKEKLNKQIEYLESYTDTPTRLEDYEDARSDLKKYLIDLPTILPENPSYSEIVKKAIQEKLIELYIKKYWSTLAIPDEIIKEKPFLEKYINWQLEIALKLKRIEKKLKAKIGEFSIKQKKELLDFSKKEGVAKKEIEEKIEEIKRESRRAK